jgi:hypothetical protein
MSLYHEALLQFEGLLDDKIDKLYEKSAAFLLYSAKRGVRKSKAYFKAEIEAITKAENAFDFFEKGVRSIMRDLEKEAPSDEEYQDLSVIYWNDLENELDPDLIDAMKESRQWGNWRDEHEIFYMLRHIKEDLSKIEESVKEIFVEARREIINFIFEE